MPKDKKGITQAEFARRMKISKARVTQLKNEGVIVLLPNKRLDFVINKKRFNENRLSAANVKTDKQRKTTSSHRDRLLKAKADKEESQAALLRMNVTKLEENTVNKDEVLQLMAQRNNANNAAIKAKWVAFPKKLALGWPDPKQRIQIETIANEYVHNLLEDMANINVDKL